MSYVRRGQDGSDVYVYPSEYDDAEGRLVEQWVCLHLDEEGEHGPGTLYAKTRREILDHLLEHRRAGDIVPEYALERLRKEMAAEGLTPRQNG